MSTGIGIGGPGGGAGSADNSWNVPGVAFVSPTGDNGTAVVGDGNKPYATWTAAQAASSEVWGLPGDYNEALALTSGTKYFRFPGVVFTGGGLTMSAACVDTHWLGHASFIGAFFPLLILHDFTGFIFEFDKIDATASAIRPTNSGNSTFEIRGNSMKHSATGGAGMSFGNQCSGSVDIKNPVEAFYGVFVLESTHTFDGVIDFNCGIRCNNLGSAGNHAPFKQCFLAYASTANSVINLNGKLYMNEITVALASVAAAVSVFAASLGTININGKINAGKQRPLLNSAANKVNLNGSTITENKTFDISAGQLSVNSPVMVQEAANGITGTASVWMQNNKIHSGSTANVIDYTTGTGQLIMNNVQAEGSTGLLVNTGGAANSVGMENVSSNLANDGAMVSLYSSLGYTNEPNIKTPDFI